MRNGLDHTLKFEENENFLYTIARIINMKLVQILQKNIWHPLVKQKTYISKDIVLQLKYLKKPF